MITFKHRGSFNGTEKYLKALANPNFRLIVDRYARQGVRALAENTPEDSGLTASSWGYEFLSRRNGFSITWTNSSENEGIPIVILIQYGHGTRSGGWVEGRDFINPVMQPLFDNIAENLWKEVTSL